MPEYPIRRGSRVLRGWSAVASVKADFWSLNAAIMALVSFCSYLIND